MVEVCGPYLCRNPFGVVEILESCSCWESCSCFERLTYGVILYIYIYIYYYILLFLILYSSFLKFSSLHLSHSSTILSLSYSPSVYSFPSVLFYLHSLSFYSSIFCSPPHSFPDSFFHFLLGLGLGSGYCWDRLEFWCSCWCWRVLSGWKVSVYVSEL
jgi:hypothetical protein